MFVGHFGIAQLGKALRREVPLAWLVIAAYLPDLVRVLIEPFTQRHDLLSHSLPIVAAFSFGIAALWQLRGGNLSAAAVLAAACVLHWPADVFTGCKPTTIHGPWIGLVSYRRPITDVLVEGSLFVGGWLVARRAGCGIGKKWLVIGLAAQIAFLLSMYNGSEFFIGDHEWTWRPRSSLVPRQQVLESTECRPPHDDAADYRERPENAGTDDLIIVGIQRRGVQLAARIVSNISERESAKVPLGALDITLYRDDLQTVGPRPVVGPTEIPTDVDGRAVVIVDDVLYTGRTVRAALDELADFGRPKRIALAVLIDRGGRELPIQPDIVGKRVECGPTQRVDVLVEELDERDAVVVSEREDTA